LLNMSLSPCCPYHPAPECHVASVSSAPCHAAFAPKQGLGLRILVLFRGHLWVHFRYGPVTCSPSLKMALSVGFISFVILR